MLEGSTTAQGCGGGTVVVLETGGGKVDVGITGDGFEVGRGGATAVRGGRAVFVGGLAPGCNFNSPADAGDSVALASWKRGVKTRRVRDLLRVLRFPASIVFNIESGVKSFHPC